MKSNIKTLKLAYDFIEDNYIELEANYERISKGEARIPFALYCLNSYTEWLEGTSLE